MGFLKQLTAAAAASVLLLGGIGLYPQRATAAESVTFTGITGLPFANGDPFKGVDLSSVISLENSGVVFRDKNGNPQDIFETLADAGVNCIRVRIWNDPYQEGSHANYGGGVCDTDCAVKIADRCAKAGLSLFVDFHYSDFWADPGKQKAPKAWAGYSVAQKAEAISQFTEDTLKKLQQTSAEIAMVQVGNETTTGMCGVMLEDYQWSEAGWHDLASLFNAGSRAVRKSCPDALVALHFTNPEKASNMAYLAKSLHDQNVDYDVFATSYYPYWHGTLQNLRTVLTNISQTYGKKVLVAETSWVHTLEDSDGFGNTIGSRDKMGDYVSYEISPAGQTAYLHDLFQTVAAVPNGKGIGVFYWEPAWLPVGSDRTKNQELWDKYGSGWGNRAAGDYDASARDYYGGSCIENEALFADNGTPLESLYIFRTVHGEQGSSTEEGENLLTNPGFEANGGWTDRPKGWELKPDIDGHFDVREEDPRSGKCALHWYSEKEFGSQTAKTTVKIPESGTYRFAVYIQGDTNMKYELNMRSSGGSSETVKGLGKGWGVWTHPEISIMANAGETLTVQISVTGDAGSYGSADDCIVAKITEEKPPEKPVGDLNNDGTTDAADVRLLQQYLLTASDNIDVKLADLSGDGIINAVDLTLLKRQILQ